MGDIGKGELYIERRKHKRVDRKYTINYRVISAAAEAEAIKKSSVKSAAESNDISLGGLRAEGNIAGKQDDIIRVEVFLEGRKEPVTTFAEIKWVKELPDNKKSFGLEFLILKDSDKELINSIIEAD
jgi:c-di-GMP-binding flagellar brake protein YcgR